jgi:NhaA family Na+:H+ antiporter
VKVGKARLPEHAGWVELLGVGMLAGIGFTVSLFVTSLAFDGQHETEAKLAILAASVVAGAVGAALLAARRNRQPMVPTADTGEDG